MGATFAESLRRFEVWMELQNWSGTTRHKYRYELVCFAADYLMIERLSPAEVRASHVMDYLGSLPPQGSKRSDALRALKAYYRYAELPLDPTTTFKVPVDSIRVLGVGAARFRQWVHAAEQSAGIERVWPHLLRHTFATHLARSGDVEAWRRGLNHADLSQWPRYVAGSDERLRKALEEA